MTDQTPRYGARVIKADTVLAELDAEYRDDRGIPIHGNATRLNHLRGLITAQSVEVDTVLQNVLQVVAPSVLESRPRWTAGQLHREVLRSLSAAEGSNTAKHLDLIGRAVKCRNTSAHGSLDVVVMLDRAPQGLGESGSSWSARREVAFLDGEQVTEIDLLAHLALQQEALRAAVQIWIDLPK
ncbi:hypothetical protein ACFVY0_34080 [Streptomyces sp. NPDC058286]|uniref:hypothetical protein n=1 Tax=Streptomyces sp. NPDC058286 TaxID=3346422 RepID=UPI0036EE26C0